MAATKKYRRATLRVLLVALTSLAWGNSSTGIVGVWLSGNGDGWIEIKMTADGPVGIIAGSPDDPQQLKPSRLDELNPDPELRSRPLLGMTIMQGFRPDGAGKWKGGTVYDPDSGKTYKCKLKLIDHNTLEIRGYIGISLLGRSETWTRRADQDSAEQDAVGARGGTRTHTSFRTTDFKSVASTSSATRA